MRFLLALILMTAGAHAEGERAGDFDYYVLSLTWAPTWCRLEGDDRASPHCDPARDAGWVLHGLWPQYESGWPSYCRTSQRDPGRSRTAAMSDLMGSGGSAWYQWKKHGRCSGLSSDDYFDTSRRAYASVVRPDVFRKLPKDVELPAQVVEEAFVKANPGWTADMVTITCKNRSIHEARICLTKDLEPRICGDDVIRDCRATNALMEMIR